MASARTRIKSLCETSNGSQQRQQQQQQQQEQTKDKQAKYKHKQKQKQKAKEAEVISPLLISCVFWAQNFVTTHPTLQVFSFPSKTHQRHRRCYLSRYSTLTPAGGGENSHKQYFGMGSWDPKMNRQQKFIRKFNPKNEKILIFWCTLGGWAGSLPGLGWRIIWLCHLPMG